MDFKPYSSKAQDKNLAKDCCTILRVAVFCIGIFYKSTSDVKT